MCDRLPKPIVIAGSCVVLMSISTLFWLILGQFIVAKWGQFAPISGWSYGWKSLRFVWLPILIHWVAGIGAGVRCTAIFCYKFCRKIISAQPVPKVYLIGKPCGDMFYHAAVDCDRLSSTITTTIYG